jgi:hypothetical protein
MEVQRHKVLNAYQQIQTRRRVTQKRTGFQPDAVELIRALRKGDARREF